MLNIITLDYSAISGPSKVVIHLIKGLDKIKYPYVINKAINATNRCYIPNRRAALPLIKRAKSNIVVGPNLYVLPTEIPQFVDFRDCIYVLPSQWAFDLWKLLGFERATLRIWPVGIDTDYFYPRKGNQRKVTLYCKKRSNEGLKTIERVMSEMNISNRIVTFGSYDEESYKRILQSTSFTIWYGAHESQGIALQECLASNVPVLVCDVKTLFDETDSAYRWPEGVRSLKVTAAPYFDSSCGLIIDDLRDLKHSIEFMMDNLAAFHPRDYILDNLSLEKQTYALINMYEHYGLETNSGFSERLLNSKEFKETMGLKIMELFSKLNGLSVKRRI